jgi:hypothetical protein
VARKAQSLREITVAFRDESIPTVRAKLTRVLVGPYTRTLTVKLPKGPPIEVYAEVFDPEMSPDVSIYITESDEQPCGLRCTSGVVVSYVTRSGYEVLVQVGTGPWE